MRIYNKSGKQVGVQDEYGENFWFDPANVPEKYIVQMEKPKEKKSGSTRKTGRV